ncbi:hypothetical protein GCM10010123_11140 [Pilimelia anulata]|uniref:NodB homology domain-containing protein n=1 Tax=Pilimelia anulata TaxID=53371 RepID=A0A8J3B7S6_9ACTN|nr:polysaccharide deacetylase family protein [Pilimelia anulata]GGJ83292.1 hypothetical protein GCM10010123_11140 [Pilimelia anulata]
MDGESGAGTTRRGWLRRAGLLALGAGCGGAGAVGGADLLDRALPIRGGAASATTASRGAHPGLDRLDVLWSIRTERKLVALTFDDGPKPNWTTLTLDTLDALGVPATFFFVGDRARRYAGVVRGRMDRHEVGNHSWRHHDLARLDAGAVRADLERAHDAIAAATGRTPRLFRPPYGHLGGSTLLAASELGYRVVLWSRQMVESRFPGDPAGHAAHVAAGVAPGAVLLAHDVGPADRLVALRGLPELVRRVRARGYRFVTVGELLRAGHPVG